MVIKLGDVIILYYDDFKFYIIIKFFNFYYIFEVFIKVILVNFILFLR